MKTFRFNLQKVLEWRKMQMRSAQEKLEQLERQLDFLRQQEEKIRAFYVETESKMLARPIVGGLELQSLAGFKHRSLQQLNKIQALQGEFADLVADQLERTVKARRDHRVLEKLRERRYQEWVYLSDRELENTAAEVFLANWGRDAASESFRGQ